MVHNDLIFAGKKYYFDVGILLSEMNVCRSTRIQAMLPVSDWQNSAKLRWLDPIIPSETEFFKLRRIGSPTVIRDFEVILLIFEFFYRDFFKILAQLN